RCAERVVSRGLVNLQVATDDGSLGFHGTVIALMEQSLSDYGIERPRIFACGPNAMLKATQEFASLRGIPCELSLESEMACGIGICQGCPIERTEGERKYAMVCTEGPCFDSQDIHFHEHHHA
ncbi:MAG: dihydroorotate dehydrogenase electron transfer subunit, partial [Bacteroidetes bacterium]|nr:dihydroorotate dehydrogenase electron transfer subunit [Bacteroidota bacterium]